MTSSVGTSTSPNFSPIPARATRSFSEGVAWLDQQRVTQAMVQLAQNAVQHTSTGDEIHLGSSCGDGEVRFWIKDHGPGVPAAARERIFGRFTRGPNAGGGAGLGLAIVQAIAEAHGGEVRVTSPPGATFTLHLPTRVGRPREPGSLLH